MASKESSLWLPAFYTRHEPFLNPSDLHGLAFSRTIMHVPCSYRHTGTGVRPRYVRRSTHPSGLASTGYPEPLRAASWAPTPPSRPRGPGSGSGPVTDRPNAAVPRRYQRGSGWLRRARGAPARPGDGVSALALRVMRVRSPHEPLTCSPPGRLSLPGRHTGGQLYPARVRRGALRPGHRDSHWFIYSAVRALEPHRTRARRLLAARRLQLLKQGSERGFSLPRLDVQPQTANCEFGGLGVLEIEVVGLAARFALSSAGSVPAGRERGADPPGPAGSPTPPRAPPPSQPGAPLAALRRLPSAAQLFLSRQRQKTPSPRTHAHTPL